jgi:hypothetical protein
MEYGRVKISLKDIPRPFAVLKNKIGNKPSCSFLVFFNSKSAARNSIMYSYKNGFSGFAAVLSQSQAKLIAGMSHFNHSKASHNM